MFEIVMGIDDFLIQLVKYWFQLISRRYEKSSTIFTSNKSYGEWGEIFKDHIIAAAVLDRILHHSTVLHKLDQKIIYLHYDFKHLTEKYFEIGMKLDDFLIQLVKYCSTTINIKGESYRLKERKRQGIKTGNLYQ